MCEPDREADALTDELIPKTDVKGSATDETAAIESTAPAPDQTRRSFLGKSGKRALYLTPVILTLTTRQAKAASVSVTPG